MARNRYRRHFGSHSESGFKVIVTQEDYDQAVVFMDTHTTEQVAQTLAEHSKVLEAVMDEFVKVNAFLDKHKLGEAYDQYAENFKIDPNVKPQGPLPEDL